MQFSFASAPMSEPVIPWRSIASRTAVSIGTLREMLVTSTLSVCPVAGRLLLTVRTDLGADRLLVDVPVDVLQARIGVDVLEHIGPGRPRPVTDTGFEYLR